MLLLLGSTLPLAAAATPKPPCPTAGKTLIIIYLSAASPKSTAAGTTVLTRVGVSYRIPPAFPRVDLSPQTVSFRLVSTTGEKIVENAPEVPSGEAGVYT
jgi:hypothetical protein